MMNLSDRGLQAIKTLKQFRARPYTDEDGDQAIGYGHKICSGDGVAPQDLINVFKAEELLKNDLKPIVAKINSATSNVSQQVFDSLVLYDYFNKLEEQCG
jgi:GH24 family phage-related lysozyme (muramidase)